MLAGVLSPICSSTKPGGEYRATDSRVPDGGLIIIKILSQLTP